jgi:hydroxyacylglutathione hydrolase
LEIIKDIHEVDDVSGHAYLVGDDSELVLIDTGMPGNASKIIDYIVKINKEPSEVKWIVLTHYHLDHVGSVQKLKALTGAAVAIHEDDVEFVAEKKTLPSPKGVIGILVKVASFFYKTPTVQPDIILHEADRIGNLAVVHTPGHTPGSISLYDSEKKVIFVGDAFRFVDGKIEGPPERFTIDMDEGLKSIGKICQLEFDVMLSGHGEPLKPDASLRVKEFYSSVQNDSPC